MSDISILCLKAILKVNEKHRVQGKGTFKVLPELESLSFHVERTSVFVCTVCVNKLKKVKKRRNLIKQVDSIEDFYRDIHNKQNSVCTTTLKRISVANIETVSAKTQRGDHGERSPNITEEAHAPPSCSSPSRPEPTSNVVPQ